MIFLVVWKLDRLSRSVKDTLHILEKLTEIGAGFRSLTENVDSTVPAGKMLFSMLGASAKFERSMVRERTRIRLQAARERGRVGGRKPKIKPNQRAEILRMVNSGKTSAAEAARLFGLHRSSVSRLISQANSEKAVAIG
jgi:DNA invertase Pin-like site-specific DNA recombinase